MIRSHQLMLRNALDEIRSGATDQNRILVHVGTGGGKGSIPAIVGATLVRQIVDKVCVLTPRKTLRHQAEDAARARWLVEWLEKEIVIRAAENEIDPSRGTHGYATTYQAVAANPDLHAHEFARYRYALILDEFHHLPESRDDADAAWTKGVERLVRSARVVILATGTLERGDGGKIAFLPYVQQGATETPDTKSIITIRYPRVKALDEKAVIPIVFKHFDAHADYIDRRGQRTIINSFDSVSRDASSDAIHAALATDYAKELLDSCVTDWRSYKVHHPSSQLLVVAHRQAVATVYAKRLRERLGIPVALAISDETEAYGALREFSSGKVDVLVTVGMAYEGLDAPAITHIACLTHIRSKPWIEQMLGRGVRVDPKAGPWSAQQCYAYVPDDALMRECIDEIKLEQDPYVLARDLANRPEVIAGAREPIGDVVALDGTISGLRASELDGLELTREETAVLQLKIDRCHLTGHLTPIELHRLLNDDAELELPPAPPFKGAGISVAEKRLKGWIQTRCSTIDHQLGRVFGTTNAEIKAQFGKSREGMRLDELLRVKQYLAQRYAMVAA